MINIDLNIIIKMQYFTDKMVELAGICKRCGPLSLGLTCSSNNLVKFSTDVFKDNCWTEMFVMQKTQIRLESICVTHNFKLISCVMYDVHLP